MLLHVGQPDVEWGRQDLIGGQQWASKDNVWGEEWVRMTTDNLTQNLADKQYSHLSRPPGNIF